MRNPVEQFFSLGWCQFEFDPVLLEWVEDALAPARESVSAESNARWHRYQNTWFAGVNVLPNDAQGEVGNSGPLQGRAIDFIETELGLRDFAWDAAQISVCFPGYPKPVNGDSPGKTRFRREKDAAHVDGLLPVGEQRRRHLREHHGFILGIPMVEFNASASPFVVWEKSHEIMRDCFNRHFGHTPPDQWGDIDVTEVYHAARKQAFERCKRIEIHARPGEAFLAHRLILHGMAPWREDAEAGDDGRMICYFRPDPFGPREWLHDA
jgi:hypothetical protein